MTAKPTLAHKLRVLLRKLLLFFLVSSLAIALVFRFVPVPTSTVMLYRHLQDLAGKGSFQWIDYRWAGKNEISPAAFQAVVASEDQRFFQHFGFDFQAIEASMEDYMEGGGLRGASTISQQVAKNLFLTPTKSFIRKGMEVWFTLLLEATWSKERILVVYLNIAEFGDHIFGIEAASQHYFGIPARRLSRAQAALLAATLPNPLRFHADKPTRYVLKRQSWILRQMRNLGELSP